MFFAMERGGIFLEGERRERAGEDFPVKISLMREAPMKEPSIPHLLKPVRVNTPSEESEYLPIKGSESGVMQSCEDQR